jgi:5-methylcytosine-specific restriction protein A
MLGRETVAADVTRLTGLALEVREVAGGVLEFAVPDLPAKDSFVIRASQRQRKLRVEFVPGTFAAPLVEAMGEVDEQGRALWAAQADQLTQAGCLIAVEVNGVALDPLVPKSWPTGWRFLALSLSRNLVAIDREDLDAGLLPANEWIASFSALLVSLLPIEPQKVGDFSGEDEGDIQFGTHRRYERSARNRAAAIALHGYDCRGCGTNLERVYGDIGREFVEIHHLTPLSELNGPVVVDPKHDLVPLCPTCHRMVHRRRPPYSMAELHNALRRA